MVASNTEACNLALISIGANPINDIADTTDRNAVLCNSVFQPALDTLMSEHEWSCAIARQQLSQLSADTFSEFEYLYSLPTTPPLQRAVTLLEYSENNRWSPLWDMEYRIEGGYLQTDLNPAALMYVRRVTQASDLDTWVVDALVALMAFRLSTRITEDKAKLQLQAQIYSGAVINAMAIDRRHSESRHPTARHWEDIS